MSCMSAPELTCRFHKRVKSHKLTSGANYGGEDSLALGSIVLTKELTGEMTCEVKGSASCRNKVMES